MNKTEFLKRLAIVVVDESKWSRVMDYIEFTEDELVEQLKTSSDIKQINKLQGKLELIKQFKSLPETIRKLS